MAKQSKKRAALIGAAEGYAPPATCDVPVAPVEEQPTHETPQPVAADCGANEAVASAFQEDDTTGAEVGQDGAAIAAEESAPAAYAPAPTLAQLQARITEAAVAKARDLATQIQSTQAEAARELEAAAQAVEEAERAVAAAEERVEEIRSAAELETARIVQMAEQMTDEAVNVLGQDALGLLDQIKQAQEVELAKAETEGRAEMGLAEATLQAARSGLEAALAEREALRALGESLLGDAQRELKALLEASPCAARQMREAARVATLVAEADAFVEQGRRNAQELENLIDRLAAYATDHLEAAYAIAALQAYAQRWYAAQLEEEIDTIEPGPGFDGALGAVVERAEEAGVLDLVQRAVDEARRRDREALGRKARDTRLFARDLARNGAVVEPGDVVAYRPGRVTVLRPLNGDGKHRVQAVFRLNGNGWEKVAEPVGRFVSRIRDRRRIVVQVPS